MLSRFPIRRLLSSLPSPPPEASNFRKGVSLARHAMDMVRASRKRWSHRNKAVDVSALESVLAKPSLALLDDDVATFAALAAHITQFSTSELPRLLENCTTKQLNLLLTAPSHTFVGILEETMHPFVVQMFLRSRKPAIRLELLHSLVHHRSQDMTLLAKASVIRALQRDIASFRNRRPSAQAIVNLLKSVTGADLTKLKLALSCAEPHLDLQLLVFQQISNPESRHDLLQHFAVEAFKLGLQKQDMPVQVVADFDDTIQLNWIDKRYQRGTMYPGVMTFISRLRRAQPGGDVIDLGGHLLRPGWWRGMYSNAKAAVMDPDKISRAIESPPSFSDSDGEPTLSDLEEEYFLQEPSHTPAEPAPVSVASVPSSVGDVRSMVARLNIPVPNHAEPLAAFASAMPLTGTSSSEIPPGGVTILTARPSGLRQMVKRHMLGRLSSVGLDATVMTGTLLKSRSTDAIVSQKFRNFQQFQQLFPELRFVVLGDSGQGDAALSELILSQYSDKVLGCFIHDVLPGAACGDGGLKEHYQKRGIVFFNTYIGAANAACRAGLLDEEGKRAVLAAAESEFESLKLPLRKKTVVRALMDADTNTEII